MAPKEGGLSPAELLMGRRIRGLVPEFKAKTKNEVSQTRDNDLRRNRQIERYNQHARDLPPLKVEDQVRVRDKIWDQPAKVTGQVGPRSYEVTTSEGGILRRNRKHHLKVKGDLERQEVAAPEVHWESMERGVQAKSGAKMTDHEPTAPPVTRAAASLPSPKVRCKSDSARHDQAPGPIVELRSARSQHPVQRLITQME